jgi:hypothetical protein
MLFEKCCKNNRCGAINGKEKTKNKTLIADKILVFENLI